MFSVLDILDEEARSKVKRRSQPKWMAPMLATLTDERFSDSEWLYERKLDGERCLAFRDGEILRLLSRNKENLNETYPEIVEALEGQKSEDFIIDGEIVAFKGDVTSFSRLQGRMGIHDRDEARRSRIAVYYYVFDVLYVEGCDVTEAPLRDRKRILRRALKWSTRVRFTSHRIHDGEAYFHDACRKGWEGLIVKRGDSAYVNSRSRNWLKFKCVNRQELVIGGYTEPEGERVGFGAIVVGFYDDEELVCAGKVGTGFDDSTLESLHDRMKSIERDSSPFDRGEEPSGPVHWITPKLVAEVGFTEWTGDNRLRHPRFIGLRRDKSPKEVRKESPKGA